MISNAYTYYMSHYGPKANTKYDTHTKRQLINSYNRMLKSNSHSPIYKVDFSLSAQKYAIDLKEHARELNNIANDLSDSTSGEITFKKSALSSKPDAVYAEYVGSSNEPNISSFEIEVSQLAACQINTSNYLRPNLKLFKEGTYTFDLDINNLTYEFEFDVSQKETNKDVQSKISRLINRSNIGLSSKILTDSLGSTAISIASDTTGISSISPTIFRISSSHEELIDTLGLDRVTQYPSNAVFSVNKEERFSTTNEFTLNKEFALKFLDTTKDEPALITLKTDGDSIVESIDSLLSSYNNLLSLVNDDNSGEFAGNERLRREFLSIVKSHRSKLTGNGFELDENGLVHTNKESILTAVDNGSLNNIFLELNDFKKSIQKKAEDIDINPMNYVNNKIIAYKNPLRPTTDPYNLSAYSGMMFNGYI